MKKKEPDASKPPCPRTNLCTLDEAVLQAPLLTMTGEHVFTLIREAVAAGLQLETAGPTSAAPTRRLTLEEAAKALGRSSRWLGPKLRSGEIAGTRVGKAWRVDPAEVERVLREGTR